MSMYLFTHMCVPVPRTKCIYIHVCSHLVDPHFFVWVLYGFSGEDVYISITNWKLYHEVESMWAAVVLFVEMAAYSAMGGYGGYGAGGPAGGFGMGEDGGFGSPGASGGADRGGRMANRSTPY